MNNWVKVLSSFQWNHKRTAQVVSDEYSSSFQQHYYGHQGDEVLFPLSLMACMMTELSEKQGGNQDQNGNTTTITDGMDTDLVVPYTIKELEALYSVTHDIETRISSTIRTITASINLCLFNFDLDDISIRERLWIN